MDPDAAPQSAGPAAYLRRPGPRLAGVAPAPPRPRRGPVPCSAARGAQSGDRAAGSLQDARPVGHAQPDPAQREEERRRPDQAVRRGRRQDRQDNMGCQHVRGAVKHRSSKHNQQHAAARASGDTGEASRSWQRARRDGRYEAAPEAVPVADREDPSAGTRRRGRAVTGAPTSAQDLRRAIVLSAHRAGTLPADSRAQRTACSPIEQSVPSECRY